jgi:MFS family permease
MKNEVKNQTDNQISINIKWSKNNSIEPNRLSTETIVPGLSELNSNDYKYSWCCITPKFCLICQNWIYIFIILNVCVFIQNLVTSGIATVIVSTMEKEFYLTSAESGLFLGIYDLAAFLSSPIIGYFGGLKNANKMRIISISLLLVTIGAYAIGLTVFAKDPDLTIYSTGSFETSICLGNKSNSECQYLDLTKTNDLSKNIKIVLFIANVVIGFGSVALYSIGIAFIEEIVLPEKSSLCQAIFYGVGAIGGGVGILITGQFLTFNSRFYLDSYKKYSNNLTTKSSNWIGCWW